MRDAKKSGIALLLGMKPGKGDDDDAPASSASVDGCRAHFDEMVQAIRDKDLDAAYEAFELAVRGLTDAEYDDDDDEDDL